MLNVDLNCDLGESTLLGSHSAEKDLLLLPYLSSINIACGFHAGDPEMKDAPRWRYFGELLT